MHLVRGWILLCLVANVAWAQFDFGAGGGLSLGRNRRAVRAQLSLSHESARPGETVMAAIELRHNPGWHTYWKNAGDSGDATSVHWALTNGISAGEIQWPVPEKYIDPQVGLTTYVYHDRAVLLVPLAVSSNAPAGTYELAALVKWLECEKSCVPGSNTVTATLKIGSESKRSAQGELFAEAARKLPTASLPGSVSARWDAPASASVRPLLIEWQHNGAKADFFPYTNSAVVVSNQTTSLATSTNSVTLRKSVKKTGAAWPQAIHGLLVQEVNGDRVGYEVALTPAEPSGGAASGGQSMWLLLLYAFLGGIILNIMPCVLPVIALKILGFVGQSRENPRRVRTLGFIYSLGVVASFLVLAGIVIGVKAAGQRAGWGMQFSNPPFIVGLTVLVTLVALNLFGVFEIALTGRAMGAAGEAASKHGALGAFMNGVLATILATPCTAPFLGAALGFAFVQPAPVIVLFFVTIAAGLALPYLLLSWNPAWLKWLPKPGAWMERFKIAMGFPMLATAFWLFTIALALYGKRGTWLGFFLVIVALAAWIFGEFVQRGRSRKGGALVVMALLLAGGYGWALEQQLRWRAPFETTGGEGLTQEEPGGIPWRRWSRDAVAQARAEGRVVLVDFTADWCLTCQANKKTSLEIESVRQQVKELNAVALLGDFTRFPPDIAEELEKHGRAGVPLVLVYPRDATRPPIVLPEILTPGLVLNALKAAAQ
jgi:thiol:disulfide interchange protein